jgi:Transglycosylase SLT domain
MPSGIRKSVLVAAVAALPLVAVHNNGAAASSIKARVRPDTMTQVIEKTTASVQLVTFPDTGWNPVKVVRGKTSAKSKDAPKPEAEKAETAEVVTFADSRSSSVRVIRGETSRSAMVPGQPSRQGGMNLEIVSFGDPGEGPVSVFRGAGSHLVEFGLFEPAAVVELDRVAFAVDGAESSHGTDLRMWRTELSGPQGPMQVTAAAAIDVGGGDRFDLTGNRTLGRAYLARLYRRYGNWPDAVAAYNWGPGNLDAWITAGRPADRLPPEVERYRNRVLRDAGEAIRAHMLMGPELIAPLRASYSSGSSRVQLIRP